MKTRRVCFPVSVAGGIALVAVFGGSRSEASNFDFDQYIGVSDPFFFGSQNLIYDYNTGVTVVTPFVYGDYYFYYTLPFGADRGFFHYSYRDGQYVEAIYLTDYAI